MERAEFGSLIERMEPIAQERPVHYRRRVFGLAALGYGYLLFVVVALLGPTASSKQCWRMIWGIFLLWAALIVMSMPSLLQ